MHNKYSDSEIGGPNFLGRITSEETAEILGVATQDVPVLVNKKLLRPLGTPSPNGPKFFAAIEVLTLARDRDWLDKATRAISAAWKRKNERKAGIAAALDSSDDIAGGAARI